MDQSHHTASGGAGSLGRRQLYLPGPEAQSWTGENVGPCPEQNGGKWKRHLIKLVSEAAGTGERKHRSVLTGRVRCIGGKELDHWLWASL